MHVRELQNAFFILKTDSDDSLLFLAFGSMETANLCPKRTSCELSNFTLGYIGYDTSCKCKKLWLWACRVCNHMGSKSCLRLVAYFQNWFVPKSNPFLPLNVWKLVT